MFKSPPSKLIASNLDIDLPPKETFYWESERTLKEIEADRQIPLSVEAEFEEDGTFVLSLERLNEESDQTSGIAVRGRVLGKFRFRIPQIETTVKGVPGLAGEVLPKGRLRGLMPSAMTQKRMDALCWSVLRRYGVYYRCLPNPTHETRVNAYQAIMRARKSFPLEMQLPYPPDDFWSGPVPETDSICWPVTMALGIPLLNKTLLVGMQRSLDALLDPAKCPA